MIVLVYTSLWTMWERKIGHQENTNKIIDLVERESTEIQITQI